MRTQKNEIPTQRPKADTWASRRLKLSHLLLGVGALYLIFISLKFHRFLEIASILSGDNSFMGFDRSSGSNQVYGSLYQDTVHRRLEDAVNEKGHLMPRKELLPKNGPIKALHGRYGRIASEIMRKENRSSNLSDLEKLAVDALLLGQKAWEEVGNYKYQEADRVHLINGKLESCPPSVSLTSNDLKAGNVVIQLPCGLVAGSSITIIGTPHFAHKEYVPQLAKHQNAVVWVSQFVVELQGLKAVEGEDPPKILHLNPRLKGDWSQRPLIEHNTCYRMQWGYSQRCEGIASEDDSDTVDGFKRCEKWMRDDITDSKVSKTPSWLRRFTGRAKRPEMTWSFPFVEGRLFVLTLRAGVEGYHINIGGRHVTSFPYRTGYSLEDATGLAIKGNVDLQSVHATSLPISRPSFSLHQVLEMSERWKMTRLPQGPVYLFIGILSAPNHFAERMAIRKTWMQSKELKSSKAVARFFVALM